MCGRFNLFTSVEMIMDDLNVEDVLFEPSPRYNISPAQTVAAVHQERSRILEGFRWGLVPHWSKESGVGIINARVESILEKPSFRYRVMEGRCVIPADGFFEWGKSKENKIPYYFRRPDGRPLYLGGIWDQWTPEKGDTLRTCTIITVPSREPVSPIHDRMPLMFDVRDADSFIGHSDRKPEDVMSLMVGSRLELESYRVSAEVNSPSSEGPHLIEPIREWF